MGKWESSQSGFTIIEMMMVISIISVISGLVLSGYRGSLAKARNQRRINAMESAVEAYTAYTVSNGTLPGGLENAYADTATVITCLGKTTHDKDSDGLSECHNADSVTDSYEEDSGINTAMQSIMKERPLTDANGIDFGWALGPFWGSTLAYYQTSYNVRLNGASTRLWLYYALEGKNQKCESYGGTIANGGTYPNMTSDGSQIGFQWSNNTFCYVALTQLFGR